MDNKRIEVINNKLFICLMLACFFYNIGAFFVEVGKYKELRFTAIIGTIILGVIYVLGKQLKGYWVAILMSTWFIILTVIVSLLYNSCLILLYAGILLAIIISYQNKRLIWYTYSIEFIAVIIGMIIGLSKLAWNNNDAGLTPFITFTTMVGVYLAYRQIHSDNEIKNKELQQKQENAEKSYSDLASLSQMVSESVSQLVGKAKNNSDEIQLVLENGSVISTALVKQNDSIENQIEFSVKIQEKVNDVKSNVKIMDSRVEHVMDIALKSEHAMDSLNKNTEHVNEIAKRSKKSIQELLNQVESVQGVVKLIRQIAEETNLLSLNASIEAAKAGSVGNGFSVVADEIRKLSNNTNDSVDQINDLLAQLEIKTNCVNQEIDEMNMAFNEQKDEIKLTNCNMNELSEAMATLKTGLNDVIASTNDVVESNNVISKNVSEVDKLSKDIDNTIKQIMNGCHKVGDSSQETLVIAQVVEKKAKELL